MTPSHQGAEPVMSTTVKPDADELKEATDAFDHPDAPQTTPLIGSQGRYKVPFSF